MSSSWKKEMAMKPQRKALRDAALISAITIIVAGIALLSIKMLVVIPSEHGFDAFLPSLVLGGVACFTLFARRYRQAQLALGVYLLAIGGAVIFLPRLLLLDYGQNDFDVLPLLLGPWYLLAGSVLLIISLLDHRHWMSNLSTVLARTLLLAGPGALLIILFLSISGSGIWRVSPYGLDIIVASWFVGIGIFIAGSRFIQY